MEEQSSVWSIIIGYAIIIILLLIGVLIIRYGKEKGE